MNEMILSYMMPSSGTGSSHILLYVIMGATALASWLVSSTLKRRFQEYSEIPLPLSGADIAKKMLHDNGVYDVEVVSVSGMLTDHYNPANKTVNLSEGVYNQCNIAAAAVAAHECGHAIQHQQAYTWLTFRSKMVPITQLASTLSNVILMVAMFGMVFMQSPKLLFAYVILLGITTLFSIVTLPVEFDASRRALIWLESSGLAQRMEQNRAKNALFWAAMTYVVAAIGAVATLLYYVSMLLGQRREE